MKRRPTHLLLPFDARRIRRVCQAQCSLLVLAGMGLLAGTAQAQGVGGTLPANTLPVLRGVVAGQAVVNGPAPGAATARMTIDQASARAVFDWRSFNIGSAAEVQFRHEQGPTSISLNRIYDADPTIIQGRLTSTGAGGTGAGGTVLLLNQNGVLFDRGAQVNTQSLIASTLNLRMSNLQFCGSNLSACGSGQALTAGGLTTAAFEGGYDSDGNWLAARPGGLRPGNIGIGSFGPASAAAPVLASGTEGAVILIGGRIDNDGGIVRSPDGQVILAAGNKAYLAVNSDVNDITLRGLRVEVEASKEGAGLNLTNLVRNAGEISADRGNVTLAALAINQEGRISARTAVQRNGSVFLTARTLNNADAGTLVLAKGSTTEVVPDTQDTATLPESSSYAPYRGLIRAEAGVMESYGSLQAPGGRIGIAAANLVNPAAARVYLGEGSVTSVAGAFADVDQAKNLVTFRVTSNELKNAPDQKQGILFGANVTADLRDAHSILALDGYRGAVARTVAEKASVGGELSIGSTGAVIQRSGAVIDASGGGYRYADATLGTSKLLGDDGRIYDIASAPQARRYVAQLDRFESLDSTFGQTTRYDNPLGRVSSLREAYVEGQAGGSVRIGAGAGLVLDGTLLGGVTIGPRQGDQAPRGASLAVGSGFDLLRLNDVDDRTSIVYNDEGQRIGNVLFRQKASNSLGNGFTALSPLSAAQQDTVLLGADQVFGPATAVGLTRRETGFSNVTVNSEGRIVVPADVAIRGDVGSSLTLRGPAIDIAGDIRLPAGNLTLDPIAEGVAGVFSAGFVDPALAGLAERLVVRTGAELSVAGAWINRSGADGAAGGELLPGARVSGSAGAFSPTSALAGGSLVVGLRPNVTQLRLERGSVLDVSSGALLDANRRLTGGRGGSLTLNNGITAQTSPDWLQSDLRAFGISNGGSLRLTLNQAEISNADFVGTVAGATTRLVATRLVDAGFASLSINAAGRIDILDGTALQLQQRNLVVDVRDALALPTGAELRGIATTAVLPDAQRGASSLALNARQGLRVGQGARVSADPGATLSFAAGPEGEASPLPGVFMQVDGELLAPAGNINLTLRGSYLLDAAPLRLGAQAVVSAAATFVPTTNDRGLRTGNVLGGGTVTLDAREAGILTLAGSRVDVSGIEVAIESLAAGGVVSQAVAGHAGTLVLKSRKTLELNGSLAAAGPGPAAGGSLAVEVLRPEQQTALPVAQRLLVNAGGGDLAPVANTSTTVLNATALQVAGFEKLRLLSEDTLEFQGNTTLDFARGLRLDAPQLVLGANATVSLKAATVSLGESLGGRFPVDNALTSRSELRLVSTIPQPARTARAGTGVLQIDAGLVDFYGSLTLQGAALLGVQSTGDVRYIGRDVNLNPGSGTDPALKYQYGSLALAGNFEVRAAQLYPATRTRFDVNLQGQDSYVLIQGHEQARGDVYSAGGALRLNAATIVQQGRVLAPQGELTLNARRLLELSPGSVTSVSGGNLNVLYGSTLDGVTWRYIDGPQSLGNPVELQAVSAAGKRLTLNGPQIDVRAGATVDLRGGGDVLAVEFVAGNGGDTDLATAPNTFAIIPKSRLAAIPYDAYLQYASLADPGAGFSLTNARDAGLYDSLRIEAGSRVPAGEYTLLPARFAMLPDAFLVQLQTGSAFRNLQPGQTSALANGETVAAGHRSARGTAVRESQSVGVVVLDGTAVSRYADYNRSTAALFANEAERSGRVLSASPWDAGSLVLGNANALTLAGTFQSTGMTARSADASYTGRNSEVDIVAPRIAVVGQPGVVVQPAGTLELSSASLNALSSSVLLGGTRTRTAAGLAISTSAQTVQVANTAQTAVKLPELIISATDSIQVVAGSVLEATGPVVDRNAGVLSMGTSGTSGTTGTSGALLRLSNGAQATVDRGVANTSRGDIDIGAGAILKASGSLLLDATRATRSSGQLTAGRALSVAAGRVSVGDTAAAAAGTLGGLVLSNADLATYTTLDELVLRAYERVDFFGSAALGSAGLKSLTLDTPLFAAQPVAGVASATLAAQSLQWLNRSTVASASAGGSGQLTLNAERLLLGGGDKASTGFDTVTLRAGQAIDMQGSGALRAGGSLLLRTPLLRAQAGANQRLAAVATAGTAPVAGSLSVQAGASGVAAAPPAGSAEAMGGRLTLEGSTVAVDSRVQARSGALSVVASAGDISLGMTAVLDAAGESRDFAGSVAAGNGGAVTLRAEQGTLRAAAGSVIDVSPDERGGRGGQWTVLAAQAELAGDVRGKNGSADIDLGRSSSFAALNNVLAAGQFNEEIRVRLRQGDVAVAAAEKVEGRSVFLTADQGRIDIAGSVGRNTERGGGRIELHAGNGLALAGTSRLLAASTAAGGSGGEVRADTRAGSLLFDAGASIDVRAGAEGDIGAVTFGVLRNAAGTVGAAQLLGQVLRYSPVAGRAAGASDPAATVQLEATRVVELAQAPTSFATAVAGWANEHQQFVNATTGSTLLAGLSDDLGALTGGRLLGATEVRATFGADFRIDSNWDLTNSAWLTRALPGTLTVRAAGNLRLSETLGAPNLTTNLPSTSDANALTNVRNATTNHSIRNGDTWNIRLVAGADLSSADVMATRTAGAVGDTGNLLLAGAAANIRTGTGRIDLAAAGDIRLDNVASAIYTAGRIGAADSAVNGNNRWAVNGGDITLRAGGSVSGPAGAPDLWVTDWLRRPRETTPVFTSNGFLTDWWSYRPRFQQGVATLGGGDVNVQAGANITDLLFAAPTAGRTAVDATTRERTVFVSGGGDVGLRAGADIDGASILLARGQGHIDAGGDIGRTGAMQAYVMGFSSGQVPAGAQLNLTAGRSAQLQSVDNPTYLPILQGVGTGGLAGIGPSFNATNPRVDAPSSLATSFFTYAANSGVSVAADGGDVTVRGVVASAQNWRAVSTGSNITSALPSNTAFAPSLALVAFGGDVTGPGGNAIKTYPSANATLVVLGNGSVRGVGLEVSDLAPSSLITPVANFELVGARLPPSGGAFSTGTLVSSSAKPISLGRIVERTAGLPLGLVARDGEAQGLYFDVQAQNDIAKLIDDAWVLPARSRLLAGNSILAPTLSLQNLSADDVSEVRAVRGDISISGVLGGAPGIGIGGPGRLLVQAGGKVDLGVADVLVGGVSAGGLTATGSTRNPLLADATSARLTVIAGVSGKVSLAALSGGKDSVYARLADLNAQNTEISALYAQLQLEDGNGRDAILAAGSIAALVSRDAVYARFKPLDQSAPEALAAYQRALSDKLLPLGSNAEAATAKRLLDLLAKEENVVALRTASTLDAYFKAQAAQNRPASLGGAALDATSVRELTDLAATYPRLYEGAVVRRQNGAQLLGTSTLVFDEALFSVVARFIPGFDGRIKPGKDLLSYQTSIQTLAGSDIDLWAPAGNAVVGLTTPSVGKTIGVLTNAGGAVRSVVGGNFSINSGKVLTAQGGDILIYSAQGNIDAGRGAKTSLSTPAPQRVPILEGGVQVGVKVVIPASAAGSGIQTLTSDPDGLGPLAQPKAGDIVLLAPAGKVDAGEAGIRSSGNILINAQVVLNASDIRAAGSSQGVPAVPTGSLAATLATAGAASQGTQQGDAAAKAAQEAVRQANSAKQTPKPTVLTVEVLGFGDKNCKEDDRDCFAK